MFLFVDDLEPNSLAVIPGMGIPEQLKLAMEQEQMGKRSCVGNCTFVKSSSIEFFGTLNCPECATTVHVEKC